MQLPDSKKLVSQDVTYLPSAPANLPSMRTLQQKGWTFDFANDYMALGSHRIRMYNIGPKGKQHKGKLRAICLPLVPPASVVLSPSMRSIFVLSKEKGYARESGPSAGAHQGIYDQGTRRSRPAADRAFNGT
jgi:hypothetical protein